MVTTESRTFQCRIDTPDGEVFNAPVVGVQVPALDGYMGILANRAPVAAVVATGEITLTLEQGAPKQLFVSRGFLRMMENEMTLLAEECKPLEALDPEAAWDLLQKAYKLPRVTDEQCVLRDEAIDNGRLRFRLAQNARKKAANGDMNFNEFMNRS
jgi:F-type H+-transporting ATPase subunit epsilon